MSTPRTGSVPEITSTLHVRQVPHSERHPLIFRTFNQLQPGQAFVLLVDHDPKPVLFELSFVQSGKFNWSYLEQGPDVWRVQMEKLERVRQPGGTMPKEPLPGAEG